MAFTTSQYHGFGCSIPPESNGIVGRKQEHGVRAKPINHDLTHDAECGVHACSCSPSHQVARTGAAWPETGAWAGAVETSP